MACMVDFSLLVISWAIASAECKDWPVVVRKHESFRFIYPHPPRCCYLGTNYLLFWQRHLPAQLPHCIHLGFFFSPLWPRQGQALAGPLGVVTPCQGSPCSIHG